MTTLLEVSQSCATKGAVMELEICTARHEGLLLWRSIQCTALALVSCPYSRCLRACWCRSSYHTLRHHLTRRLRRRLLAAPSAPPVECRGVPARTFDGSIAAIEAPAKYSCPPTTGAQGSVGRDARDYIAEVDVITGERCFNQARAVLLRSSQRRGCPRLPTGGAPHPGRSYVSARCTPLA